MKKYSSSNSSDPLIGIGTETALKMSETGPSVTKWVHIVGTALLYFLAGKFALLLAVPPGYASPIWPAAGLALTCILLFGKGVWPGIVIGHFLVNVGTSFDITTTDAVIKSILIPVVIGIGGALQAILGSILIRRAIGWPNPLVKEKEILLFFLLGGPLACLVSSTIGVSILLLAGIVHPEQIAANWLNWWFGDTLGALVAPPLLLVWFEKPEKLWRQRRTLLFLPIFGALVASVILFFTVSHTEQTRIETEFENHALLMADSVKVNLNKAVDISAIVVEFMQHSQKVTRAEFKLFVNQILKRNPFVKAISWEPIVLQSDRQQHEEEARREGLSQYAITERSGDGSLVTAPPRDKYVPIYFLEPYVGNEPALGYNLASEPKRLEGLKRTEETGQAAVSERIWLVQDTKKQYGVLFLQSVYGFGKEGTVLKGFVSVVIYVADSIRAAMPGVIGENYIISVNDLSAPEGERALARFGGNMQTEQSQADFVQDGVSLGIFHQVAFNIAGRKWEINVSPTQKYVNMHYSWSSWASLSIGMLFCGLLSIFLLSLTGKAMELEKTVRERTAEVTDLYNLAPCGYHSLDNNGVFVQMNDTELKMLGYSRDEVIGKMKATDVMTDKSKEIFRQEFPKYLATGNIHDVEFEWVRKDGSTFNILLSGSAVRNEKGEIVQSRSTIFDITERKKGEDALQSIHWLLQEDPAKSDFSLIEKEFEPDYGDLTKLNKGGEIINSVDRNTLYNIVSTFLELLETSSAIYEANGDYALGIFSSSWCRFMDRSSRKQCGTDDNRSALVQGKWLCHESCWNDASRKSIKEWKPVDVECHGGLRLYAVPIIAGGKCIGSINFGYGNPPADPEGLMKLAKKFSVDIEEITKCAKEYKPRPPFLVELAKRRLHDSAKLIGILVERKHVEDELQKSRKGLVEAQQIAKMGNWEFDIKTNKVIWSDQTYRLFGFEPGEVSPSPEISHNLIHPDDRDRVEALLGETLEKGVPYEVDYRIFRNDGVQRFLHSEAYLYRDENGNPFKLAGINQDVTEQKNIEEALHKAKEEAEIATKLKDKFVSLVSHDLKSPVASMIGFLKLIRHDEASPPNEGAKAILDAALDSGHNMLNLIEDVLNIGRIQSGRICPQFTFINGFLVGVKSISDIGFLAKNKGIEIANDIPQNTRIYADQRLFEEVLKNLVSNSVKFCKAGDRITLFIPEGEPSTIAVSDTGIGMQPEVLPKLFDCTEKTSTIGTAGERGTGFGLPLCHDIMLAHGGSLSVESELGKGSTFFAKLPFVKPRVLFVDDEKNTRTLYAYHLNKLGAETFEASNGREALDIIKKGPSPHLVITDLYMPEMDGFELIKKIKENPKTSSIPVILLTADDSIKIRDMAFQLKAEDYMHKSINLNDFIPRVRRFIG